MQSFQIFLCDRFFGGILKSEISDLYDKHIIIGSIKINHEIRESILRWKKYAGQGFESDKPLFKQKIICTQLLGYESEVSRHKNPGPLYIVNGKCPRSINDDSGRIFFYLGFLEAYNHLNHCSVEFPVQRLYSTQI